MGYTHYYDLNKADEKGFQEAIPVLKDIIERHKNIICFEMGKENDPPELTETVIRFNGKFFVPVMTSSRGRIEVSKNDGI